MMYAPILLVNKALELGRAIFSRQRDALNANLGEYGCERGEDSRKQGPVKLAQ